MATTDAERDRQIAAMQAELQELREFRDFWSKPAAPGVKSRMEQAEDMFRAMDAGKMTARFVLWAAGAIVAVAMAWQAMKAGKS